MASADAQLFEYRSTTNFSPDVLNLPVAGEFLAFETITIVPTDTGGMPAQVEALVGYPDKLPERPQGIQINGGELGLPARDNARVIEAILRAADFERQGYGVDCSVMAALVAGRVDAPVTLQEASHPKRAIKRVSIFGSTSPQSPDAIDWMPAMGVAMYFELDGVEVKSKHFAVRLPTAGQPRILSKLGPVGHIVISDVLAPASLYRSTRIGLVDTMQLLVDDVVRLEYVEEQRSTQSE